MDAAKKLLSVLLSFVLVLAFTPAPAFAETAPSNGEAAGANNAGEGAASADATGDQLVAADAMLTTQDTAEWTSDGVKYTYTVNDGQATILTAALTNENLPSGSVNLVIPNEIVIQKEGGGEDRFSVVALGNGDYGLYFSGDGNGGRNKANLAIGSVTVPASVASVGAKFFASPNSSQGCINTASIAFAENSPVTTIPATCFSGLRQLGSVTLPAGITDIGQEAFANCSSLTTVTYAGSDTTGMNLPTTLKTIGAGAFQGCASFTSVAIPEGVTSIGANAFTDISAANGGSSTMLLESVTLPDSLTTIGEQAFYKCSNLTTVAFGAGQTTAQLQTIGMEAFKDAALTSALIPDSVTSIGQGAFQDQKSGSTYTLSTVTLGSTQEASQLQTIGIDAFRNAAITEIALPNMLQSLGYSVENPETTGQTPFAGCTKLKSIKWPTAQTEHGFTAIGGFWDCSALDDNNVISSIPSWISKIDNYAFYRCAFTSARIPNGIIEIGQHAFEGNKLAEVTIPASVTSIGDKAFWCPNSQLSKLTIAEGPSALSIGDYEFYNLKQNRIIELPKRVSYLGESTFYYLNNSTFYIYNKDITFKRYGESYASSPDNRPSDPWRLGSNGTGGSTCYYPQDAGTGSNILYLKAEYEAHTGNHPMDFLPFDATKPMTYAITGTVPKGADVVLFVDGEATNPTWNENTFTYKAPRNSMVSVSLNLDGYAGLTLSPAANANVAPLTDDWPFTVELTDMTPLSKTGTLQVRTTGNYNENANVAVFDHTTGKLVSQGTVLRARVHFAENLPTGTYDVVAWQANDYFSSISSIADFAALGFDASDYASDQVDLAARETKEIELAVPALDTSKVTGVLASGGVTIPNGRITPGVAFRAEVTYAMAKGRTASAVKLNIPKGMTPVAASSPTKSYGVAGWDADSGVLTISGLAAADQTNTTITVSLVVANAGAYALNATVTSGNATVPVGSARVETSTGTAGQAMDLVVPQGTLSSATFTAYVYAAPGTKVGFKIGSTDLGVTCITNKVGLAQAELTIPDAEKSAYSHYLVTATSIGDNPISASEIVEYSPIYIPYQPTVRQFYFDHAGSRIYLVRDGMEVASGSYVAYVWPEEALPTYSPTWPFVVVVDSLQPLQDILILQLGMADQSVRNNLEMKLQSTENLANGGVRYTYTYDLPVGDGNPAHIIPRSDIPVRFDIVPQPALDDPVSPKLTQANVDALKRSYAKSYNEFVADAQEQMKSETNQELLKYWNDTQEVDSNLGVFNAAFRHDKWDPQGEVWNTLDAAEKAQLVDIEEQIATLYNYLAWYMGDKMPMYAYSSLEDYLADNYGFQTGQFLDPATLEAQGYFVVYDNNPNSVPNAGTPNADGQMVAPAWTAVNVTVQDEDSANGGTGTISYADANGNVFSFTRPLDRWAYSGMTAQAFEGEMDFQQDANENNFWNGIGNGINAIGDLLDKFKESKVADGAGKALGIIGFAFDAWQSGQTVKSWGDYNSLVIQRENELKRLKMMEEYYKKHHPDSPCLRALQTEIELIKPFIKDLKKYRLISAVDWPVSSVFTGIGGYSTAAALVPGTQEVSVPVAVITAKASSEWSSGMTKLYHKLAPDADWHQANLKRYRAYRERICSNDEFGKLHYKKYTKFDPSGYVYEGITNERVEGVVATIYQLVNGTWKAWTEAAEWDEINPQVTNEAGLFAWDVPEGSWKVLFQKAGYDDVWSQVMEVLPEWTNVAINMLRKDAPKMSTHTADKSLAYVDVSFDQLMKTNVMPVVTVGGKQVEGLTWQAATMGRDEKGANAKLSRTLRVTLPSDMTAGNVKVALSGGESYAGKPFGGGSFEIAVPAIDIKDAKIAPVPEQRFTGRAITPALTVTLGGKTLVAGKDYEVAYTNNVNAGTATATVTGKGFYGGTTKTTFTIVEAPKPNPGPEPEPIATQSMHRLYNPNSGEHFYTADENERSYLSEIGWTYEGVGWTAPETSDRPVYRLYNRNAGDHHYTLDANERDYLIGVGWEDENIGWYSADESGTPLYRQYNPNATGAGSHNYTADENERDYLVSIGWNDEEIGWYGL